MKHDLECCICGAPFEPKAEKRYTSQEPQGLLSILANNGNKLHDTFDCPECGCQNIVNVRFPVYWPGMDAVDDEAESCGEDCEAET